MLALAHRTFRWSERESDMSDLTGLGRRHWEDKGDLDHLVPRMGRRELTELPPYKLWSSPGNLDQGNTPQCVAYSWTKWRLGGPVTGVMPYKLISEFYHQCQLVDEWPGEDYDGTSVRAGAKVLKREGMISEYVWAPDHLAALKFILTTGPMVFGTDWFPEMGQVDRWGYIDVPDARTAYEGHAYCVVGADTRKVHPLTKAKGAYRVVNSWGRGWGQNGRFWLTFDDADRLIRAAGEACAAIEIKKR